jgi:hypothetical protein
MFSVVRKDEDGGHARLESDAVLTPENFQRIAGEIGISPIEARKIGHVAVRTATKTEVVETCSNGKETTNTARPGDYIVTNLSPQREPLLDRDGHLNIYVIRAAKFPDLYELTGERGAHGAVYRAKGVVSAIPLPGGFDIAAPWGERQTAEGGYLVCNGREVYGVSSDAFDATYVLVAK